jgi:hypothetical protein
MIVNFHEFLVFFQNYLKTPDHQIGQTLKRLARCNISEVPLLHELPTYLVSHHPLILVLIMLLIQTTTKSFVASLKINPATNTVDPTLSL